MDLVSDSLEGILSVETSFQITAVIYLSICLSVSFYSMHIILSTCSVQALSLDTRGTSLNNTDKTSALLVLPFLQGVKGQ